ncbi:MAG: protein kinase, partial [Thermoplasmata archaeon]|nr:protein kinase [Thermoplasmata archaeon]
MSIGSLLDLVNPIKENDDTEGNVSPQLRYPKSTLNRFLATIGMSMIVVSLATISIRELSEMESAPSILLLVVGLIMAVFGILRWHSEETIEKEVYESESQRTIDERRSHAQLLRERASREHMELAADALKLRQKAQEEITKVRLPDMEPTEGATEKETLVSPPLADAYSTPPYADSQRKYVLQRVLGKGGLAIVYLAKDHKGRNVVIKRPWGYRSPNEKGKDGRVNPYVVSREKLILEASFLRNFRKKMGIVELLDFFLHDDEVYEVLRYVEGPSLTQYVKEKWAASDTGGLEMTEALRFARQIISILKFLHDEMNMVHRDITPGNFLVENEQLVLTDLGTISKHTDLDIEIYDGIQSGGYHSPEQARGASSKTSDIFSLGSVMYFLLTGMPPPVCSLVKPTDRAIQENLIEKGIHEELIGIVLKARAVSANLRYEDTH